MLTVLHGEDTTASYLRLQELLSRFPDFQKIKLSSDNSQMLYQAIFGKDILDTKKVIIAQDLLSSKEINTENLKNISPTDTVFFWERKELPASILKKLPTSAVIQIFKPNPVLFKLLDNIGIDPKTSVELLQQLSDRSGSLTWNIENRLLLLILIKMGFNSTQVAEISGRQMQNWQWSKIQNQSKLVNLLDLKRLFSSTLKLEMMIKNGLANQGEKSLISMMFLKHSQS